MFKKIIEKFNLIKNLRKENILLKTENIILKRKVGNPIYVVEKIFDKGLKWFDWNEASIERRRVYFDDAQKFLSSEIVNNIKNYLIATGSQTALLEYHRDSDTIRDFQMSINGIELLFTQLETIQNPDQKKETIENIYNGA